MWLPSLGPRRCDSSQQQLSTCFPPDILQHHPGTSPSPATGDMEGNGAVLDLREQGVEQLSKGDRAARAESEAMCSTWSCMNPHWVPWTGPAGRTAHPTGTRRLHGVLLQPAAPCAFLAAPTASVSLCSDPTLGHCQSDRVWLGRSPSPNSTHSLPTTHSKKAEAGEPLIPKTLWVLFQATLGAPLQVQSWVTRAACL